MRFTGCWSGWSHAEYATRSVSGDRYALSLKLFAMAECAIRRSAGW
jgi:hypothetical protein